MIFFISQRGSKKLIHNKVTKKKKESILNRLESQISLRIPQRPSIMSAIEPFSSVTARFFNSNKGAMIQERNREAFRLFSVQ